MIELITDEFFGIEWMKQVSGFNKFMSLFVAVVVYFYRVCAPGTGERTVDAMFLCSLHGFSIQ